MPHATKIFIQIRLLLLLLPRGPAGLLTALAIYFPPTRILKTESAHTASHQVWLICFSVKGATLSLASLKHVKMQEFWKRVSLHLLDEEEACIDFFWPIAASGEIPFLVCNSEWLSHSTYVKTDKQAGWIENSKIIDNYFIPFTLQSISKPPAFFWLTRY